MSLRKVNPKLKSIEYELVYEQKMSSTRVDKHFVKVTVPDYVKSVLWCRRRWAYNWNGEPLGNGKEDWGGKGRGRSVYKQPGTRVDRGHATHKGGIPSKWKGLGNRGNYQGDLSRGLCHVLWYCQPCIYRSCYCVYVANKRIVFRL